MMLTTQTNGYLALPPGGLGNPVLVLHPWWGLNDTMKAVCTRLAAAGFVAFAPDLYHGQVTTEIATAEALAGELFRNPDQVRADLAAASAFLRERAGPTARGLAVVGFSLGASYALDLSFSAPAQIRQVVLFYGTGGGDYSKAQAAYQGHFAEQDDFEPRAGVDELAEALRQAGRAVTFYHYPGTGHWFAEPDRLQAYNAEAAALAWDRTLAFLRGSPPA
jgi:carboxymethylenebutenolidase